MRKGTGKPDRPEGIRGISVATEFQDRASKKRTIVQWLHGGSCRGWVRVRVHPMGNMRGQVYLDTDIRKQH